MPGGAAVLSLALILGPVVGPLTPVDTPTAVTPMYGDQTDPALAASASTVFAVWKDGREGLRLYGAMIDVAAAPAISRRFAISPSAATAGGAPGFDGTNFLVAWSELNGGDFDVFAARYSPAGIALDAPVLIAGGPGDQLQPAVAFDGTRYLVAFNDWDGAGTNVRAALVSISPALSAAPSVQLNAAAGLERTQFPPAVAFDGTRYLVAFALRAATTIRDTRARRVTTGGAVEGAVIDIAVSSWDEDRPSVAARTGEFLVAFAGLATSSTQANFIRIRSDGTAVDTSYQRIGPNNAGAQRPMVVFDSTGGNWVVLFGQSSGVYAQRFSLAGASLDGNGVLLTPVAWTAGAPVVAGSNLLIFWEDFAVPGEPRPSTGVDLFVSRLARPPALVDAPVAINVGNAAQKLIAAATGADGGLVAYGDYSQPLGVVRAVTVSPTGAVGPPSASLSHPDAGVYGLDFAASGAATLACYRTATVFFTYDYTRGADAITPVTAALASGSNTDGFVRIAAASSGRFVQTRMPDVSTVEYASLSFPLSGGAVTRSVLRTATVTGTLSQKAGAACIGTRCATVFEVSPGDLAIGDVDVSSAGGTEVVLSVPGRQSSPSLATNGVEFALAYSNRPQPDGGFELRAARFGFGETALRADVLIRDALSTEPSPVIAWDGASFWVLFVDRYSSNIRAARLHPDGGVATPGGITLFGTGEETAVSAAASGAPGTLIVGVERFIRSLDAPRVFVSTVRDTPGPAGSPCATVADCTVAFCAGGYCCPTACGAGSSCASGQCTGTDGGQSADAGQQLPDGGGTVLEDGGVLLPDGGGTVLEDGGVLLPDGGGVLLEDGGILLPDGGVLLADGGVVSGTANRMVATVGCDCGATGVWPLCLALLVAAGVRRRRG